MEIKMKYINKLAFPLMLNSVLGLIIGLTDQAMVGRISLNAFGAVGLIGSILYSISGVFGMISVGFNILGARSYGQGENESLSSRFTAGIVISTGIGLLFFIGILIFGRSITSILFGLNGEILDEAMNYFKIYSLSVGLNMLLFMFSAYFRIINKTKYVFYASTTASLSNVLLDYIFIFGKFGFPVTGVRGAALASVLAMLINLAIYLIILKGVNSIRLSFSGLGNSIDKLLRTSLPLMGQEILDSTLFVFAINSILSRLGILELSIYSLLSYIINIALMPMYAYSSAAMTFIGKSFNITERNEASIIPIKCLSMASLFFCFNAVGIILLRRYVIGFVTNDLALIEAAIAFIGISILTAATQIPGTVYKNSLQAVSDGRYVFAASVMVSLLGVIIIYLFATVFKLKLMGVYLGMGVYYLMLSTIFYKRYYTVIHRSIRSK